MKPTKLKESVQPTAKDKIETHLNALEGKIEFLKTQFNLYFSGELRVPPESEREELEKQVREIHFSPHKSSRAKLLIENLSSKFSLYNNMWKKRLNEIESGMIPLKKKTVVYDDEYPPGPEEPGPREEVFDLSLNREDSFEKFYDKYTVLAKKDSSDDAQKEKFINSIKAKLIGENLIDARVSLAIDKGKLKLKVKK
ncbi:MAG: hypothetical protein MUF15_13015 [Acidobacteria bacterium]|jgi:hypothetical protein|nr:hypothetical protein [Acidobacteriota bacterium]